MLRLRQFWSIPHGTLICRQSVYSSVAFLLSTQKKQKHPEDDTNDW
jgi:hypothetical protein